jgi:hypothetical protein
MAIYSPDYQMVDTDEMAERLADEPNGDVRVRFFNGSEDVYGAETFAELFTFVGKDDTDAPCEHGVEVEDTCPICD